VLESKFYSKQEAIVSLITVSSQVSSVAIVAKCVARSSEVNVQAVKELRLREAVLERSEDQSFLTSLWVTLERCCALVSEINLPFLTDKAWASAILPFLMSLFLFRKRDFVSGVMYVGVLLLLLLLLTKH